MSRIGDTQCIHVSLPLYIGEWLYGFLRGLCPEIIEENELDNLETAVLAIDGAIMEVWRSGEADTC